MENLLTNINMNIIESRVMVISVIIIVNLIASIVEALKQKRFDVKKLPEFISEWTMCVLSVVVIEVILAAMLNEPYIQSFLETIRNVMFISILACYLKKIYESLLSLGWDVTIDTSKITGKGNSEGSNSGK